MSKEYVMYRVIYRNPFEKNSPNRVVINTTDLNEAKHVRDNIWLSLVFNQTMYDGEPVVYCEDLATGERLS